MEMPPDFLVGNADADPGNLRKRFALCTLQVVARRDISPAEESRNTPGRLTRVVAAVCCHRKAEVFE